MRSHALKLTEALLDAVFPPRCGCAKELPLCARTPHGLCEPCHAALSVNDGPRCESCDLPETTGRCQACCAEPPAFVRLRAPYLYGGVLAELVQRAKFNRREDLAAALGHLLAVAPDCHEVLAHADALVPVPLGRARQRERGYNQAAVLARVVGQAHRVPVRHLLTRSRNTVAQSELTLAERSTNMREAFESRACPGQLLVLVDDVVTSGATAREASAALVRAGAREVRVLAAARVA